MSSKLIPFEFQHRGVRVIIDEQGDPWFVAKDVADILEYSSTKDMTRLLDEDEKGGHILETPGGNQEMIVISESGLYHAIFVSRKPEAQAFRRWITNDVMPSIRRTGGYGIGQTASTELLNTQRKLIAAQEARMEAIEAEADKRIALIEGHVKEQLRQAYIELADIKKDLEYEQDWHERAAWVLRRRMEDKEGLEITAWRRRGYTWTRIAGDWSYRSASSLSNQFRMWQARRSYAEKGLR